MASALRPLIAGNWKMNGFQQSATELASVIEGAGPLATRIDLLVCPPATLIAGFATRARNSAVAIGAQDCHAEPSGAFTGDISAEMLRDAGASAVIVGHSERRTYHKETNADVRAKALAAWRAGLVAIVCVGASSLPDGANAAKLVVAYEPVWAIGTGLTPTADDVAEVHGFIRERLVERYGAEGQGMRILYGGSVKPSNASELLRVANVNGALVGGASLKATDLLGIARAR